MNMHRARSIYAIGLVGLLGSPGILAEQPSSTPATPPEGMQHGGMQHGGMGSMAGQQPGMAGMQHGTTATSEGQQAGGMQGMQHGGAGGGMMGGMGGGMMASMSDKELEDAWQKLQAQDIRLGELRRQIREANDQAVRDKLKGEHQTVLKDQLALMHKLMMQEHMKSMKGGMSMGGAAAPGLAQPAHP